MAALTAVVLRVGEEMMMMMVRVEDHHLSRMGCMMRPSGARMTLKADQGERQLKRVYVGEIESPIPWRVGQRRG